jgi:hypothetical protein
MSQVLLHAFDFPKQVFMHPGPKAAIGLRLRIARLLSVGERLIPLIPKPLNEAANLRAPMPLVRYKRGVKRGLAFTAFPPQGIAGPLKAGSSRQKIRFLRCRIAPVVTTRGIGYQALQAKLSQHVSST